MSQGIPTSGPATHPNGPREYSYSNPPFPPPQPPPDLSNAPAMNDGHPASKSDLFLPQVPPTDIFHRQRDLSAIPSPTPGEPTQQGGAGANHYPSANGVPRLPPILQVEKLQVTTSATQVASASRRRNEAHFSCPVPGCGSTFTRRFNLRGHLRSHTEERPYVCNWPGCKKGFARQHDCKRHQALHTAKSQANVCQGCKKTFSRLDALNRHLRSDNGAECRALTQKSIADAKAAAASALVLPPTLS
ncbi:hypothetical protein JOM56_002008 [Amanita muscaria]